MMEFKEYSLKILTISLTMILQISVGSSNDNKSALNTAYPNVQVEDAETDVAEVKIRNGLTHLKKRINAGKEVRIAYLGGSITQQDGWRVYSLDWFREQYPNVDFKEIRAAIGGTNSRLGVFRVDDHVLKFKPDLVFIEFAVNDNGLADKEIEKSIEGIIRKIKKSVYPTDVCLIYTINEPMLPDMGKGRLPRTVKIMEGIAGYYNLPSINFGTQVVKMKKSGELIFKGRKNDITNGAILFSEDGTHPLVETGHTIYLESFVSSMTSILESNNDSAPQTPIPLRVDNYENARLAYINRTMLSGNWEKSTHSFSDFEDWYQLTYGLPEVFRLNDTTAVLTANFKGSFLGIYDVIGPDAGTIEVMIDGKRYEDLCRFDGYCTYHRFSSVNIATDLGNSLHTVKMRLSGNVFDKEKILRPDNKKVFVKNPEEYKRYQLYPIALMVLDEK
jgi:hypothetical protein